MEEWKSGIYALTPVQRRELAAALVNRTDRAERAREAFRQAYPNAPEEMISRAIHHVYVDGPQAVLDWLATAELFLRDPSEEMGYGPTSDLLYHVYNWHQFQALLPSGTSGLLEFFKELKEFAKDGDLDAVLRTTEEIEEMLEGDESAPDYE